MADAFIASAIFCVICGIYTVQFYSYNAIKRQNKCFFARMPALKYGYAHKDKHKKRAAVPCVRGVLHIFKRRGERGAALPRLVFFPADMRREHCCMPADIYSLFGNTHRPYGVFVLAVRRGAACRHDRALPPHRKEDQVRGGGVRRYRPCALYSAVRMGCRRRAVLYKQRLCRAFDSRRSHAAVLYFLLQERIRLPVPLRAVPFEGGRTVQPCNGVRGHRHRNGKPCRRVCVLRLFGICNGAVRALF